MEEDMLKQGRTPEKVKETVISSDSLCTWRYPMKIQIGNYEIKNEHSSPDPFRVKKDSCIFICEFCLVCVEEYCEFKKHKVQCNTDEPLGKEIYNKEELSVFEVDGLAESEYCKNVSLLGKIFLHDKKDSDVEDFIFYILTTNGSKGKHIVGYFSKEKEPELQNNLSCLLILPQYQRQGYGYFLIEFSYLLSRLERLPGTPERPLSKFGKLTYESYWKNIVGEYLYHHIDEKSISVKSISDNTGIDPYDIGETLQMMNLVKQRYGRLTIVIKKHILAEQMRLFASKKYRRVDEEYLNWMPSILGVSPEQKKRHRKCDELKRKCIDFLETDFRDSLTTSTPVISKLRKGRNG